MRWKGIALGRQRDGFGVESEGRSGKYDGNISRKTRTFWEEERREAEEVCGGRRLKRGHGREKKKENGGFRAESREKMSVPLLYSFSCSE